MSANLSRLAAFVIALTLLGIWLAFRPETPTPIRIGVIHALSGVMANSERSLVDAARLAVEEINTKGGLLGRPIEILVADSRSDWTHAAAEAERLIRDEGVSALFACWTSSCRQAIRPVVEKYQHLMFYPLQYEGMEQSPNIIYMGATPNQQIIPGARWAMDRFGSRVYLVGSNYLFPHAANLLITDLLKATNGQLLAERHQPMSATDFTQITEEIRRLKPDVVLNTLNGDSNHHFFSALTSAGLEQIPVVSFSISESELQTLGKQNFHPAHFAVWGYFQSLPGRANQAFIKKFQQRFGPERITSDPILTSYNAVLLWAVGVHEANSTAPIDVNRTIGRVSIPSPSGIVSMGASSRHMWRRVYLGKAKIDGQFDASEISQAPVRPAPFPPYLSRDQWLQRVKTVTDKTAARGRKEK